MFVVYCDNKGCGKHQEPKLDLETNEAICAECGEPIKSVTEFAKTQMRALGQIRRDDKRQQAFAVKCDKCNTEGPPKLIKVDKEDKLVCFKCGKELDKLSAPYRQTVLEFLRTQRPQ